MEKCHLASIRLPLSSPLRSERWGEGLLKRVLKGCEPPFAFEITPSLIFISTEHVKHVLTPHLKKKWKRKSEISLNLNFKNSPAKGRPDSYSRFLGMERCEAVTLPAVRMWSKAERSQAILSCFSLNMLSIPLSSHNQYVDLARMISWKWKTQIIVGCYISVYIVIASHYNCDIFHTSRR